jgi:CO/xanthine dehydrogenase FAD-binding subunit
LTKRVFLPKTLNEVWAILEDKPHAAVYAGGTDLLVRLRSLASPCPPTSLICLERIEGLKEIREEGCSVFIGACVTHTGVMMNPLIQKRFPILVKALRTLGSPPVRNMGTLGGNICTASPAGDSLPPLYVLDTEVEICSREGPRRMTLKDFITGPGETALREGELLYGLRIEADEEYSIHRFEKVGQRKALAISIASFAALMKIRDGNIIEKARCAWGSVGPTIVVSKEVEDALTGQPFNEKTLRKVIPLVEKAVSPIDDLRARAAYRRTVAGNLVLRLLEYT